MQLSASTFIADLRARLARHRTDHRAIATGLVVTIGLLLLAKLAGLTKEVLVAFRFGTDMVAGVYALAFLFALWPVGLWTSVASSVLIPLLVRLDDTSESDSREFRAELFGMSLLGGLAVGALVYGALRFGVAFNLLQLSPSAGRMVDETALAFGAVTSVGLLNAQLTCQLLAGRNPAASVLEGLPSLCVSVLLALVASRGPWPLVLGTLFGFVAQFIALSFAQPHSSRFTAPRFSFRSSSWVPFWRGVRVLVVSQALLSVTTVIDQIAIIGLGHGANATLGYSNRIVLLATSLIALALSRVILPVLARAGADRRAAWRLTTTWALVLLAAGTFAAAVIAMLAPILVQLLFERGSFTTEDTRAVSSAVRFGLLQIPFFCASMVLAQYVAATQRYSLFLWGNILNLFVKIGANAVLIPTLGVAGAMLATAVMYVGSAAFLWVFGRPKRGPLEMGAT